MRQDHLSLERQTDAHGRVTGAAALGSKIGGRIDGAILSRLTYEAERSRELGAADRSSIYGGFHVYVVNA